VIARAISLLLLRIEHLSSFVRDEPILSSKRILYKGYNSKGSVKKFSGREPQGAWRQDEPIGGIPPFVK
jgi:hypothetical protein